jgi:hypothetical protein
LPRWLRSLGAGRWPVAEGTLETGEVTVTSLGKGKESAIARVGYSFSIAGEYYSGYCLERIFNDSMSARKYVDEFKGRKVFIRYDPQNPNQSVWRRKDQPF